MMRLLLILLLAPVSAEAQQVRVRSGEHPGFTRIVIETPSLPEWEVGMIPGGWEFRVIGQQLTFDLRQVWRLITQDRLAAISSPGQSQLQLAATCECHLRTWVFDGKPILDIHDGPARRGAQDLALLPEDRDTDAGPPVPTPPETADAYLPPASPGGADDRTLAPPEAQAPSEPARGASPPTPPKEELDQAIDRAAARRPGPGSVADPALERVAEARRRAAEFEARLREQLDAGEGSDVPSIPGIEVAESRDPPTDPDSDAQIPGGTVSGILTADGLECPAHTPDPTEWGSLAYGQPDFPVHLTGLTGEFDDLDPQAVLRAAKYYLFLGFGAEARQLLHHLDPPGADLLAMAEILDNEAFGVVGGDLDGWESCDSPAAFWSTLAGRQLERGQPLNGDAVLRTFQGLPAHLRHLLGPRLVATLLSAGHLDLAERARNATILGRMDPSVPGVLAEVEVEKVLGTPEAARDLVQASLADPAPGAAELILEGARIDLAAGRNLTPDQMGALEALAFENRLLPLGAEIQRALVEAEIRAGHPLAARDRLEGYLRAQDTSALYRLLHHEAVQHAGDTSFLRLALPGPVGLGEAWGDAPTRMLVAARLSALGFPAEALATLGPVAQPDSTAQLVAARAMLALGRTDEALELLAASDLPEALAQRAKVHEDLGQTALARVLYDQAGKVSDERRVAVLDGDWGRVASGNDPLADAAEILAGSGDLVPRDDPYAGAEELLSESARERAIFGVLLADSLR